MFCHEKCAKIPALLFATDVYFIFCVGIKVFCNSIGWVKSARALNSWMTSVSYARDRAPKYCIEIAWDSHYIKSKIAQIPMTVFAKL